MKSPFPIQWAEDAARRAAKEAAARLIMPWSTDNPRAREEWDFRPQGKKAWYNPQKYGSFEFLADEEVFYCNYYERARHEPDAAIVLENRQSDAQWMAWRKQMADPTSLPPDRLRKLTSDCFDGLLARHLASHKDKFIIINWFYTVWPDWPGKPFLSVSSTERRRRYKACFGHFKRSHLPVIPLNDIHQTLVGFETGNALSVDDIYNKCRHYFRHGTVTALNEDTWVVKKLKAEKGDSFYEIAALEIDFSFSDKILIRRFASLLKEIRKSKGYPNNFQLPLLAGQM